MKLEDIRKDAVIVGLEPEQVVRIVATEMVGPNALKEELLKFDGTPLFPERRAYTVNYQLSDLEAALYAAVTDYVKEQFNKADQLADGGRKGTVGFALTSLQRHVVSVTPVILGGTLILIIPAGLLR
jgi:hypothetical protein